MAGGVLPDTVLRFGIRRLIAARLEDLGRDGPESIQARQSQLIAELRQSPVAVATQAANRQHYELPAEFFARVLGRNLKYSCAYFERPDASLDAAEDAMLALTCARAGVRDGERVLDLGCGWGSLTLWMATRYPASRITAVSNSHSQRLFIERQLAARGLGNVEVLTADVNELDFPGERRFDRIISIEMLEHVRNYERLLGRMAGWLERDGTFFVHVFCHERFAYPFETTGPSDWIGRHFFSGGLMPSRELLLHFQRDLVLEEQWSIAGGHYQRTAEHWLRRMTDGRNAILPILEGVYGPADRNRWWNYWRTFFMVCSEVWGYRGGTEWLVAHYRFARRG